MSNWNRKNDNAPNAIRWLKDAEGWWPKIRILKLFYTHLPQWISPFGIDWYYDSLEKHGDKWYAPHNLWRGFMHLVFGTIPALFYPLISFCFLSVGILLWELSGMDFKIKQWNQKNSFDWICWNLTAMGILVYSYEPILLISLFGAIFLCLMPVWK